MFHFPICAVCFLVQLLLIASEDQTPECSLCDPNSCQRPRDCLAGFVKDSCNCCHLCGLKEGERCKHKDLAVSGGLGDCGDKLECRMRKDLDWNDPPEAVCVCRQQKALCGSDEKTYENICQLTEERYRRRDGLRAISSEPCRKAANITHPPQNVKNVTGGYAAMICEAKGWPIPTIEWVHHRDGSLVNVPGNASDMSSQVSQDMGRGETTSWLQFRRLVPSHAGLYSCSAINDVGTTSEVATLTVL